MHPKYLWGVCKRELINILQVLLHCLEHWDAITFVELESGLKHALIEPQLMERGEGEREGESSHLYTRTTLMPTLHTLV